MPDSIGGQILRQRVDLLAPFGRAVGYGIASGKHLDIPQLSLVALKYVGGFALLAWRAARPEQARQEVSEVAEHVVAGRLRTSVRATFPLAKVAKAHQMLDDRWQLGRVLVVP